MYIVVYFKCTIFLCWKCVDEGFSVQIKLSIFRPLLTTIGPTSRLR